MKIKTDVLLGDCKELLKQIPDNTIDLVFTSPPYSDQRKDTYGGVPPEEYVDWFLPISEQLLRVLKPTGTFMLNIKEKIVDGERSTYVIELILALRRQGWLWTEEFIWHKKNPVPGKWDNRFKDAWERLLQFNKTKKFNMYKEEVMVPMKYVSKYRFRNLRKEDDLRKYTSTGSGFNVKLTNFVNREMAYPSNVLYLPVSNTRKKHPATFPECLPEWFLKVFTREGDTVLDPFAGSGTTLLVSQKMRRNSIGIEIKHDYYQMIVEDVKTQAEITIPPLDF